jgi:glucose-fructose oxidoreductase
MGTTTQKIRYAVVGQGWFAQTAVLPAFANAEDNSTLAALVSGDPAKRAELSKQYEVPAYDYDDYDSLLSKGDIDAVFIVLPNSMHHDFTVRAARAGVHVLVEKPMAANVTECEEMIAACAEAGVKLMVAYRLHFEEGNLAAVEAIRTGRLGEPRVFTSANVQQVLQGNTRLDADLAGGPLMDIGIYCINAARYLFRDDPVEVTAFATKSADPRFREVPEMVSALMRFSYGKQAGFVCGFGEAKVSAYQVIGTRGSLRMDPAYSFDADLEMAVTVGEETERTTYRRRDQVGAEIVYFSDCIRLNRTPEPSGLEGLADLRIIEAIKEAAKTGEVVALDAFPTKPRPGMDQEIHLSPPKKTDLIHAAAPGKG